MQAASLSDAPPAPIVLTLACVCVQASTAKAGADQRLGLQAEAPGALPRLSITSQHPGSPAVAAAAPPAAGGAAAAGGWGGGWLQDEEGEGTDADEEDEAHAQGGGEHQQQQQGLGQHHPHPHGPPPGQLVIRLEPRLSFGGRRRRLLRPVGPWGWVLRSVLPVALCVLSATARSRREFMLLMVGYLAGASVMA